MKKRAVLRIDLRDKRLPGGRLTLSARTRSVTESRAREQMLRQLMDDGNFDVIETLRRRGTTFEAIERAQRLGNVSALSNGHPAIDLTLGAQIDRLLVTVKATKSAGTYKQYVTICKYLVQRFGRETPLTSIRSDELQAWIHEPKKTISGKPWSHARQRVVMAIVSRLFTVALAKEAEAADAENRDPRIRRSPVKNVELPAVAASRVELFRPAEWRALSEHVEGRAVHVLLALGVLAGLRIGECQHLRLGLDVVDIDGPRPTLKIQPRTGGYPWVPKGWPKRKRSMRTVPIGAELARIIRKHIQLGYSGERYLIVTHPDRDRPVNRDTLGVWTARAFRAASVEYGRKKDALTHHSCRHTFISWLVQADVSLKKIEKLAGTSVQMILNVYGHLIDEDLDKAVAVVDRVAKYPAQLSATGPEKAG